MAGGPAIGTPKFIETAGADVAEGVFFTGAYPTNDLNDTTRAFATEVRSALEW